MKKIVKLFLLFLLIPNITWGLEPNYLFYYFWVEDSLAKDIKIGNFVCFDGDVYDKSMIHSGKLSFKEKDDNKGIECIVELASQSDMSIFFDIRIIKAHCVSGTPCKTSYSLEGVSPYGLKIIGKLNNADYDHNLSARFEITNVIKK